MLQTQYCMYKMSNNKRNKLGHLPGNLQQSKHKCGLNFDSASVYYQMPIIIPRDVFVLFLLRSWFSFFLHSSKSLYFCPSKPHSSLTFSWTTAHGFTYTCWNILSLRSVGPQFFTGLFLHLKFWVYGTVPGPYLTYPSLPLASEMVSPTLSLCHLSPALFIDHNPTRVLLDL